MDYTLNPSQYKVVYTCFSTFSPNDFYRNLATELGSQAHYRKPDNFRVIQEELTRLSVEKRKTPVICIYKRRRQILYPRKASRSRCSQGNL